MAHRMGILSRILSIPVVVLALYSHSSPLRPQKVTRTIRSPWLWRGYPRRPALEYDSLSCQASRKKQERLSSAPSRRTYNSLIYACVKAGNVKKGVELLAQMQREKIQPDVVTFTTLMSAPEAKVFFSMMRNLGIAPNAHTLSALLKQHRKQNVSWEMSLRLYKSAKQLDQDQELVNNYVSNALMSTLNANGQWAQTLALYQQDVRDEMDQKSCVHVMRAAFQCRRYGDVIALWEKFRRNNAKKDAEQQEAFTIFILSLLYIRKANQAVEEIENEINSIANNRGKIFKLWLRAIARAGLWKTKGRAALAAMASEGRNLTTNHLNLVLKEISHTTSPENNARDIYSDFRNCGALSQRVGHLLLDQLSRTCDTKFLRQIISRHEIHFDSRTANSLLKSCNNDWKEAMEIFREMATKEIESSPLTYKLIAISFEKAGKLGDFLSAIEDSGLFLSLTLNPDPYKGAIAACGETGRWQDGLEIIENMRGAHLRPDNSDFADLTKAMINSKKYISVLDILRKLDLLEIEGIESQTADELMKASFQEAMPLEVDNRRKAPKLTAGLTTAEVSGRSAANIATNTFLWIKERLLPGEKLGVRSHDFLLQAYLYDKRWGDALRVFDQMIAINLRPTLNSCNKLIYACRRGARVTQALNIVRSMRRMDILVTVDTYNALVSVCGSGRQWELSLALSKELQRGNLPGTPINTRASLVSYNILINALLVSKKWQKALETLHELKANGFKPDNITFSAFEFHAKGIDPKNACSLADRLRNDHGYDLSPRCLRRIVISYADSKEMINHTLSIWNRIPVDLRGPRRIIDLLIITSCGAGEWEKGLDTLLRASSVGAGATRRMLHALGHAKQFDIAAMLFKKLSLGNQADYETLLAASAINGKWQTAIALRDEMHSKGLDMTSGVMASLVRAYGINGRIREGLEIFNEMRMAGITADSRAYTSLITMFSREGLWQEGLGVLGRMVGEGMWPTDSSYSGLQKACERSENQLDALTELDKLRKLHEAKLGSRGPAKERSFYWSY